MAFEHLPYATRRSLAGLNMAQRTSATAEEIATYFGTDEYIQSIRDTFKARSVTRPSYIYLLDTVIDVQRFYKIGVSVRPDVRLRQMQSGRGANMPTGWDEQPVRPLALRLGNLRTEFAIHQDLSRYRIPRSEWFIGNIAVAQYIVNQDVWLTWQGEKPDSDLCMNVEDKAMSDSQD